MAKLSKLISTKKNSTDPTIELLYPIEVFEKNQAGEFYTDPRTIRSLNDPPIVKPIAKSSMYIYYVCPHCGKIHIETKRRFNIPNRDIETRCKSEVKRIIIDWKIEPIAFVKAFEDELEEEWNFMKEFEDIRVREYNWWCKNE